MRFSCVCVCNVYTRAYVGSPFAAHRLLHQDVEGKEQNLLLLPFSTGVDTLQIPPQANCKVGFIIFQL